MNDQKNTLLAIVLSGVVLLVWSYFFAPQLTGPAAQKPPQTQAQNQGQNQTQAPPTPGAQNVPAPVPGQSASPPQALTREAALKESGDRVTIDTPSLKGSIALKGARIDDVSLTKYRETVDPNSPPIDLLSPSRSPDPFYAEFGWLAAGGATKAPKLPGQDTVWRQESSGALTPTHPIVLAYDNGAGLTFLRTISVDDKYLFTVKDEVANGGNEPVTLYPFGLVARQGNPPTTSYGIQHEGPIGKLGDKRLRQGGLGIYNECQEESYKTLEEKKELKFDVSDAWFGFTDKYWAATLIPDPAARLQAKFSYTAGQTKSYQADYILDSRTITPGASGTAEGRLFAGAKEVHVVNNYNEALKLNHFDLLIDWGHFFS